MPEGFKLLDAYVEVKANATGVGEQVSKQFTGEIAPAAKKMAAAVETATRQVASSSKRQEDAAASLRLAQMRLADVQKTAKEGSTQLAAAQEAVARATRNVTAAAEGAQRAQSGLSRAEGELRRSGERAGNSYIGGLKGAFTSGAVGGLVGGVVGGVTSGLTSLIGTAVSDIAGMLTQVGGLIASTVIDYNSQLESANIAFTTMLHSGTKARGFLNDLQNFAQSTPFEFTDVVRASQRLMAMGVQAKDTIPYMTAIGDAVAGMGGSAADIDQVTRAIGQMNVKTHVQGDELLQLNEAGINAVQILADSYHVSADKMQEMISAGDVLSKRAVPALIRGLEHGTKSVDGFGGMMAKQSKTFVGSLSNIRDGLTRTTAQAFKPFFDAASRGMGRFATTLSGKPAEKFQKDVTKSIKPLAKGLEDWFKGVDINKIFKEGGDAIKGMFKGLKPKDITNALDDLTDVMKDLAKQGPKVGKAIKQIGPAIPATIRQVADLAGGISDFIDWLDKLDQTSKKSNKNTGHAISGIVGWLDQLDQTSKKSNRNTAAFFSEMHAGAVAGWGKLSTAFQKGVDVVTGFFGRLPGKLATIGGQIVSGFLGGIRDNWGKVTDVVSGLVNLIPKAVRDILGIASPSKVFHLIGQQVGQGLHRGLLGSVDQIKEASTKLADAVMGDKRFKGTTLGHRMVAAIKAEAKELEQLSARRDRAADRLATARSNLTDVLGARKDFAGNVRSSVMGNADATSIFGTSMQGQRDARQAALDANASATATILGAGTATLNGNRYQPSWTTSMAAKMTAVPKVSAHAGLLAVKANLKKLLGDTRHFARNLDLLMSYGIDMATYDELVQAGVRGGGLETSDALINDPKLARSIFGLERQIGKAGGRLGTQAAGHEYYSQVRSARNAVARDQHAVNAINVTMVVEARKIDEVDKLIRMVHHVKQTARKRKGRH